MSDNMDDQFLTCPACGLMAGECPGGHPPAPSPLHAFTRTPEFRNNNIDCTYTANGFRCSFCNGWNSPDPAGIPVVRVIGARPDYPLEVERVDLLICPFCVIAVDQASATAENTTGLYTTDELEELAASADEEADRIGLTD